MVRVFYVVTAIATAVYSENMTKKKLSIEDANFGQRWWRQKWKKGQGSSRLSTENTKAIFSFLSSMNLAKLEGKNCVQILGLFRKSANQKLKLIFISLWFLLKDYFIVRRKKNLFSSIDPYISSHGLDKSLILQLQVIRNSPSVGQQCLHCTGLLCHHDDCPSLQRSHQEFKHEPATPDNHIWFMGNSCRTCHYERQ